MDLSSRCKVIALGASEVVTLAKQGTTDPRLKRCPPTAPRSRFLKAAPDWDKCYEFRLQRRSWRSAHISCLEKKGRLVTIRERRIQRFLVDTMYGLRFGPRRVWIGANDRANEMQWVWVTGESVHSGYSNWARGQPSCGITCIEDCAVMNWREAGGRWHDYHCSWFDDLPYICEYGSNSAHIGQVKGHTQNSSFGTESLVFLIVGLLLGLSSGFCLFVFILLRR
ncbi:collectin-12 [Elysia marginata]|uniref:Collectin-12 n=1 Tax=Elysia marginata TaxID=1093978 RepID=A0AAV4JPV1_9GAST|nr:collectin-12 [Elysia marginata]